MVSYCGDPGRGSVCFDENLGQADKLVYLPANWFPHVLQAIYYWSDIFIRQTLDTTCLQKQLYWRIQQKINQMDWIQYLRFEGHWHSRYIIKHKMVAFSKAFLFEKSVILTCRSWQTTCTQSDTIWCTTEPPPPPPHFLSITRFVFKQESGSGRQYCGEVK